MATKFGAYTTAAEVVQAYGAGLSGKVVIVTGASSGIGVETARAFASAGAHVICAVRNLEKAKPVVEDIVASTHNKSVETELLDLSSLASVREFAKRFLDRGLPLHVLINNAGIMAVKQRQETVDGFESQFGTNHVGPFVLTNLLVPALLKGKPSRVVVLTSIAHKNSGVVFDDLHSKKSYNKWVAYSSSKAASVLFVVEFNRRMAAKGVVANAVHPGGIMTGLQKDMDLEEMRALGWLTSDDKPRKEFKNEAQGASTSVWAALAPEVADGGFYCEDCHKAKQDDRTFQEVLAAGEIPGGVASHSLNLANAEKLWKVTEELVGQKFDL